MLVRVAQPQRRLSRLAVLGAALLLAALAGACRRAPVASDTAGAVMIAARLQSIQPTVGPAALTVTLSGGTVETLGQVTVQVVGHMAHPGMTPVVATVTRRGPDTFDAALDLDMPGDWVLVTTVRFPDSRRVESQLKVRVQPRQP